MIEALAASAEAAVLEKAKKKRAAFEKEGATFTMKVNLEGTQPHFQYYLDNQAVCLGLTSTARCSARSACWIDVLDKKGKKKKARGIGLEPSARSALLCELTSDSRLDSLRQRWATRSRASSCSSRRSRCRPAAMGHPPCSYM